MKEATKERKKERGGGEGGERNVLSCGMSRAAGFGCRIRFADEFPFVSSVSPLIDPLKVAADATSRFSWALQTIFFFIFYYIFFIFRCLSLSFSLSHSFLLFIF